MLAAAQALHLMPMGLGAPAVSPLGTESGSIGLSLEAYKLLAASDSESESDLEGVCAKALAVPQATAP